MPSQRVKIVEGGKLVIPAAFRREMGIAPGDTVVVELDAGELRVRSLSSAIRQVQARMRGRTRAVPCLAHWEFADDGPLGWLAGKQPLVSFRLRDFAMDFG